MVSRVLIVSPDTAPLERMALKDARFHVLDSLCPGADVPERIRTLGPDLLLCEGLDARALSMTGRFCAAPPRVLCLSSNGFQPMEADVSVPFPAPEKAILSAMARAALLPVPVAAQRTQEMRMVCAAELLRKLGVPEELKGHRYLLWAAATGACSPFLLSSFRDALYPALGCRFLSSPGAVERAMRTAIEATWLRGSLEGIQTLFGLSVDAERGKPTNREFVFALALRIRQTVQAQMDGRETGWGCE